MATIPSQYQPKQNIQGLVAGADGKVGPYVVAVDGKVVTYIGATNSRINFGQIVWRA